MLVSDVSSATEMTAYPASKIIDFYQDSYGTGTVKRVTNTFVITVTANTNLYAWGYVNYIGGQWSFDKADLRATRIA
jgi:hypothetical protein